MWNNYFSLKIPCRKIKYPKIFYLILSFPSQLFFSFEFFFWDENINISENNIISVQAANLPRYYGTSQAVQVSHTCMLIEFLNFFFCFLKIELSGRPVPHASRWIGNVFDSLWQLHKCTPLDFTYCASSHKRMYLKKTKRSVCVCVCVCVFLLACLLACVLLWATSEEMKLFLLSSNLNNFSSNLLVGRLPCKHKALDQIFLSIWRAPYIHEYFVKRIHEEVTQFVKWIVWCVYSLSICKGSYTYS